MTTWRQSEHYGADVLVSEDDTITRDLNAIMEFGRVIEVHSDGTVTYPDMDWSKAPPEVTYVLLDGDGQMIERDDKGTDVLVDWPSDWDAMKGYTGQDSSGGAAVIMHPSEFIGGRMARDILANPGLYVALPVDGLEDTLDAEPESIGWMVAFKAAP